MAIWQYKVINLDQIDKEVYKAGFHYTAKERTDDEFVEEFLNFLGHEGWELVAVDGTEQLAYLKRPKSTAVAPNG